MTELQHYLERSSLREVTIEPYLEPTEGQSTEPGKGEGTDGKMSGVMLPHKSIPVFMVHQY